MNFELELENSSYIEGDESVEDAILRMVVSRIVGSVNTTISTKVDKAIEKIISEQTKKNTEEKIDTILDNFMSSPITVSNGYKKEEYDSVLDMVEQKFTSTYQAKLSGSCSEDKLLEKIKNNVSSIMRKYTDQVESMLKVEGRKIARAELEASEIAKVINTKQLKD